MPLHVFTDDTDTYVAADFEDLIRLFKEETGEDLEGEWRDYWRQLPDDNLVGIYWEDPDRIPPGSDIQFVQKENRPYVEWTHRVTASAAVWAAFNGSGLLCSTEC